MIKELTFRTNDGLALYGQVDLPEDPKAVVVIVHGAAEHLNRYDELVAYLTERHFVTIRYDQRGHGRSEGKAGKRMYIEDFNEFPDDVKMAVDYGKEQFPDLPVFVIGHSMGGFSVVAYGTKYPGEVNGIVTSGALTRLNNDLTAGLPSDVPADAYLPNELGGKVCSDPAVVAAYAADPLVEKELTAGLFINLAKGVVYLKNNAEQLIAPILILHGNEDGLIAEKDSRDLFGEIGSIDKKLIIYPKLYHEIFNEPVKATIYEEVATWLEERL